VIVVDASALGAFVLEDHGSEYCNRLRDVFVENELIAPADWPIESMNLIVKARRQGRIPQARLGEFWSTAESVIAIARIDALRVDSRLLDLVKHTGLTPRDAAYLELAERRGAMLATADNALLRESRERGITTIAPAA